MYVGRGYMGLEVRDLEESSRFYEGLGPTVVDKLPGMRAVVRRSNVSLALMTFIQSTCAPNA